MSESMIPLPFGERIGEGEGVKKIPSCVDKSAIPPLAPPFEGGGFLSRRVFMATAGATATALSARSYGRTLGANDRIRIGFIGPGRRGFGAHVHTLARLY